MHPKGLNLLTFSPIHAPSFSKTSPQALKTQPNQMGSSLILHKVRKEFVVNFPCIESYRGMTRISLTQDNMQKIHEKLEVQNQGQRSYERRVKMDDLYLKYDQNPLTNIEPGSKVSPPPHSKRSILDQLHSLKQRNFSNQISTHIDPMKVPARDNYIKLYKQRQRSATKQNRKEKENPQYQLIQQAKSTYVKTAMEQLDEIVNLPDANIFQEFYKRLQKNIFALLKTKNHRKFHTNKEMLEKYYFCFDSVVTHAKKKSKFTNRCIEEISSFSREIITNDKSSKVPNKLLIQESDITAILEELKYEDLMFVASNRLQSQELLKYFREDEESSMKTEDKAKKTGKEEKKEEPVVKEIQCAEGLTNRKDNFNPNNQDRAQIEYYNKSFFTAMEKKQTELSMKYQNQLKKLIEMERMSISNSIKDKSVLKKFKNDKDVALLKCLENDADQRSYLMKETERKIRMNKMNKNRSEKVKIDHLVQTFKMKKRLEAKTSPIGRSLSNRQGSTSPFKAKK